MLGGIRALPVGLRASPEEETAADFHEPEGCDHPHELFVARGPRSAMWNLRLASCASIPSRASSSSAMASLMRSRSRPVLRSAASAAMPGSRMALTSNRRSTASKPQVRDPEAAVGVEVHQAFAREPPQGLAHGGA